MEKWGKSHPFPSGILSKTTAASRILRESIPRQVDKKSEVLEEERGVWDFKEEIGVWNSQGGGKDISLYIP